MYQPTSDDVRMLRQKNKKIKISIDFLNEQWQIISNVQGTTTDFTISIDGDSDIRRTVNLTLIVDKGNIIKPESVLWIDKYAKISIGYYDYLKKKFHWYKVGRYVIKQFNYNTDSENKSLTLSLVDLMALFTEDRGNQITTDSSIPVSITYYPCPKCGSEMEHKQKTVKQIKKVKGTWTANVTTTDIYTCSKCKYQTTVRPESTVSYADIDNAMRETVERFSPLPYNRFNMQRFEQDVSEVPYDLEYSIGVYPIQIIKDLRDLYPCRQTFFDEDGVFTFNEYPMADDDIIILDTDIMDDLIISEEKNADFGEVCNVHDIWGKSLEADRTAESTEYVNYNGYTIFYLNFSLLNGIGENKTYGFTPPISPEKEISIILQSSADNYTSEGIPLYIEESDGYLKRATGENIFSNIPYVFRIATYKDEQGSVKYRAILQGELQIRVVTITVNSEQSKEQFKKDKEYFGCDDIYYDVRPNNPFTIERIGYYIKACNSGEYDNIYSTSLAAQRGKYENYKSTRLNTKVTLITLIVPWLDVKQKIRYTSPSTKEVKQYLIDKIDFDYNNGTMTLSLTEFYPFYEWLGIRDIGGERLI